MTHLVSIFWQWNVNKLRTHNWDNVCVYTQLVYTPTNTPCLSISPTQVFQQKSELLTLQAPEMKIAEFANNVDLDLHYLPSSLRFLCMVYILDETFIQILYMLFGF